jgi:hypothetical protein
MLEKGEKGSLDPLPLTEFEPWFRARLQARLPDPLERAQVLLSWLGRAYQERQDLLAPTWLARYLYSQGEPLRRLAEVGEEPELARGFQVLLGSIRVELSKGQRRLRKSLMARLGLDGPPV